MGEISAITRRRHPWGLAGAAGIDPSHTRISSTEPG